MKTSLIVLTLNEAEGMKRIMPKVKKSWVDETIVVDGGSTDGTIELAKKMGYRVFVQDGGGRGDAFRVGLRNSRGDILVYFSPDGNEVPQDIPKLISKIKEGYDMAIASRFSKKSKSYDATLVRRFGNNLFTFLINLLYNAEVDDAVNGFRAITRKCMEDLKTDARYFDIEIQMTIRAAKKGYKICEIPTIEPRRIKGEGKLNTAVDGWRYTKLIASEFFK